MKGMLKNGMVSFWRGSVRHAVGQDVGSCCIKGFATAWDVFTLISEALFCDSWMKSFGNILPTFAIVLATKVEVGRP